MAPVIKHLRVYFSELPSLPKGAAYTWNFAAQIKQLGPDFYRKIVLLHPILNLEYSVLCEQIRESFTSHNELNHNGLVEKLTAALMLADLLEHIHEYYLNVPREVLRLRTHKKIYKVALQGLGEYTFPAITADPIDIGRSLSQHVREYTVFFNPVRLLINRSKRFLNCLNAYGTGSEFYKQAIDNLDYYGNPILLYFAWCFFTPRCIVNLFLLAKHIIPGEWMAKEERALGWWLRMQAQLQRRWFELANDVVWVIISLANCFVFIDSLAYIAPYTSLFGLAYDVVLVAARAYIELGRIGNLQKQYALLWKQENEEGKKSIQHYDHYLDNRYYFELMRLGLSVIATTAVLIAASMTLPPLAAYPLIPLIGSLGLVTVWVINFTLVQLLEHYRPKDNIEAPSNLTRFSMFAPKNPSDSEPSSKPIEGYFHTDPRAFTN